ncbi:MAG: sugar-binding transcriptional regulator, partial [Clostridia bacterium]|nr:sugar-binding transcriptional regulator [Clostridia bacterium]
GARRLDVHVLPARGGMGMAIETQAGTLAAEIAHALGGRHSLLHVPDSLSQDALKALLALPEVRETIDALHHTDVLLYGIGRAEVMAANRSLPEAELRGILSRGAVGEAVGNYFGADGRLVFQASEVGLSGEELRQVPHVVAVAAGAAKARAVAAVMRHHHHELLVIDEGAARAILALT